MLQPFRILSALRRFARARDGATAVEFGFIALPMILLVFGTIELGMVLLVSTTLDTGMEYAAREIRTGEFKGAAKTDREAFAKLMCSKMSWLNGADCSSKVVVEAQTFSNFTTAGQAADEDPEEFDPEDQRCWTIGNQGDIVVVRAYYAWPLFTPLLDATLVNRGDNTRLITSTRAFKNEPFGGSGPMGARCDKS